jgi:2-polyprenyl-6-hydroxyphenyl methylase/3-demethylubiquinone-9 3-methyltransferase
MEAHSHLVPKVLSLFQDLPSGSKVLDIGCGNGSFLAHLKGFGWQLYGSDSSASGIAIARQTCDGIHFFQAGADEDPSRQLEQCDGPVDAILCVEVIEHLYDPRSCARLCNALLRPGGMLLISTPYHGYLKNLALAVTGQMDKHFAPLDDGGHIKFWSQNTLRQLLHEAGFTAVRFQGSGRLPYLWKSMIAIATKPRI